MKRRKLPTSLNGKIVELHCLGMGIGEIAEAIERSKDSVYHRLRSLGVPARKYSKRVFCIRGCGRRTWKGKRCKEHWIREDTERRARNMRNLRAQRARERRRLSEG